MSDGTPEGGPLIYLMAGEPSGDLLGGRLMTALKEKTGGRVRFAGIGGETMIAAGLDSLFPMHELSLMGLVELLPRARKLIARQNQTAADINALLPEVIITIDSPGFCIGVLNRLKGLDIPKIHYVAPSVWAWRPGRVKKFVGRVDQMLALLPFEPPWFENAGLPCTFVGHPVIERGIEKADGPAFRARNEIPSDSLLLGVFLGSRHGEIKHHLPVFRETTAFLASNYPDMRIVIPAVEATAERLRRDTKNWPLPAIVVTGEEERYAAMAASNFALAASGTVAMELACARVPTVVAYRINPITEFIARRMVKVDYANLCNIIADEMVVPERIQRDCKPDILAEDLIGLIENRDQADTQVMRVTEIMRQLAPESGAPSERAADVVLEMIGGK